MVVDKDDILAPEDEFGGFDSELGGIPDQVPVMPVETIIPVEAVQVPPTPIEGQIEAPTPVRRAKKAGAAKKGKKALKRRTLTRVEKAIRLMLRRSGKENLPQLEDLMKGKAGKKIAINEIGIFAGTPKDPLIAELATECMVGNTLNFSAEITKLRMLQVGTQIIKAGRMHSPIHVAQIQENGSYQCVSGLHRLAFLILVYGADAKIPVYVETMTLEEARDAMGVANDSRPAKAKERAELAVLKALKGKSNVNQDDLYTQMATSKINSRKYCVYSVMERGYPLKLNFKVSATASRKDGGLTTLSSVETFLHQAMDWTPETERVQFDKDLKDAVEFINALAAAFVHIVDFNPDYHITTKPMTSIGKYYLNYKIAKKNPIDIVESIAEIVVGMGDVSRTKSEDIFNDLMNTNEIRV
jgi:hypothetical protein